MSRHVPGILPNCGQGTTKRRSGGIRIKEDANTVPLRKTYQHCTLRNPLVAHRIKQLACR